MRRQRRRRVPRALKLTHLTSKRARCFSEAGVGRGIQRAIDEGVCTLEKIFVTTKLCPSNYNERGVDRALETLGLDYIDLMLLHQPAGDYMGGYAALEKAVGDGKLRSIALSNFPEKLIKEVIDACGIAPAFVQVEAHPYYPQTALKAFLKPYGTAVMAWFPLGGRGHTQEHLGNGTITAIAEAHGVSAAQVIIRWHIQDGHIAIPCSKNIQHIKDNVDIFDFTITDDEISKIAKLDRNKAYYKASKVALLGYLAFAPDFDKQP